MGVVVGGVDPWGQVVSEVWDVFLRGNTLELLVALLVGGAYLVLSVDAEDVPEYE